MKIALIAAMSEEVAALLNHLDNQQDLNIHGINFYVGKIRGQDVVISQVGIGKVNASFALAVLYEHFKPDFLINAGVAGGIGQSVHVGDIVVSTEVAHHDVDVKAFGYEHGQVPKMPTYFEADRPVIDLVKKAYTDQFEGNVVEGLIVSGDQFINRAELVEEVLAYFPKAVAIDMESSAVGQVCYQLKLPFVIVRAISDKADSDATSSFFEKINDVATHSADAIIKVLTLIKEKQG